MVVFMYRHLRYISKLTYAEIYCQYRYNPRTLIKASSYLSYHRIFPFASTRRSFGSGPFPKPGQNSIKFWPFAAITLLGSGAYMLIVKSRSDMSTTSKTTTSFTPDKVSVIFILGGPGSGKGTQCARLVQDYNFIHLSAGDLLRAEQEREGSEFGDLIRTHIREGLIVPMEVTNRLLEKAMIEAVEESRKEIVKFLIDGFPRKMDQALKFEEKVCPAKLVIFFDCTEEEMQKRLLKRGETSGRTDDNLDAISKRFKTFVDTSMPVVEYFKGQNRVIEIDSTKSPEEVYKETCKRLKERQII